MKKLTVKKLIEFRGKSDRSKRTFVNNFRKPEDKSNKLSGGDYWICALSAIRNTFKSNSLDFLDKKIELLNDKIDFSEIERIQNQFQRNLDIVSNFKEYDFEHLKPNVEIKLFKQSIHGNLLNIKDLPIEAKPCFIYSFPGNNGEEIGGVWFIAKLDGYKKSELGMFADILYRYLRENYSNSYFVNPAYCIAVDIFKGQDLNYKEIQDGSVPALFDSTLEDFKRE